MTVAELIVELQKMPSDALVVLFDRDDTMLGLTRVNLEGNSEIEVVSLTVPGV